MNEKRLPPRLMVLLVVLKGEKVYKIPLESGIKLDHLKDLFQYTEENLCPFSTTISWSRF
jgi:hypothetical protein